MLVVRIQRHGTEVGMLLFVLEFLCEVITLIILLFTNM